MDTCHRWPLPEARSVPQPPAARRGAVWHHVIQRGVAQRPLFSSAEERRSLEELLALAVRRGRLEVHAFTVLTTHCHLLVRAPRWRLTAALRGVFAPLARRINRRLDREGPLFCARSRVVPVTSTSHWRSVITYIDQNSVEAGLADRPARYPFSSAWHYARESGPEWLRRDVVEAFVRRRTGKKQYEPAAYTMVFAGRARRAREIAARRMRLPARELDPLDDLLAAAPADVRRWLERRARLADGASAGPVLVGPAALLAEIDAARGRTGTWTPAFDPARPGRRIDGWRTLAAGLLRTSSGLRLNEIATALGLSQSGAQSHVRRHLELMPRDEVYADRAESVLSAAMRKQFD